MKRVSIVAFIVIVMITGGCQKEKSKSDPPAKADMLGTWNMERRVDETWQPIDVLIEELEEIGQAGDSVIFKKDNLAYAYQDRPTGVEEDIIPYEFLNDSTIRMDEENYVIRKLTANELYLHQEEISTTDNVKDVVKLFLVR